MKLLTFPLKLKITIHNFINRVKEYRFIGQSFWSLQSTFIPSLIALVPSIMIKNILTPGVYGHVAAIDTIATYLSFPGSILRSGMDKGVPELKGHGDHIKARHLQETVLSTSIILSVIVSIVIFVYALNIDNTQLRIGSMIWSLVIAIQIVNRYYKIYFKTELEFKTLGKIDLVYAVALAATNISFVWIWGFPGLYLGSFLIGFAQVLNYSFVSRGKLKYRFSLKDLKFALKSGLPFLVIGLFDINLKGMDRLFVLQHFSVREMGIYSITTLVFTNYVMINSSVLGVFFQRHFREVKNQTKTDVVNYLFGRSTVLSLLGGFIIGATWYFIPIFLMVLPEYAAALVPARIILIGCYFFCISGMYLIYLIGQKKTGMAIFSYTIATLCAFFGLMSMPEKWVSLSSVVVVMDFSFMILFFTLLISSSIHLKIKTRNYLMRLFILVTPLVISVITIFLAELILSNIGSSLSDILRYVCGGTLFALFYSMMSMKLKNFMFRNISFSKL
jgi:O-antigen/teichoic acid export membrane protein